MYRVKSVFLLYCFALEIPIICSLNIIVLNKISFVQESVTSEMGSPFFVRMKFDI